MIARLLLCVVAGSLLSACRGDDASTTAATTTTTPGCAAEVAHPIDPSSSQHLLPGAPEPHYSTEPPTSGAHRPGNYSLGSLADPMPRSVQVALLETGYVLVQHRDDVPAKQRRDLRALAGDGKGGVVVAPNDALPAPIVATAWLHSMNCQRFDKTALEKFLAAHSGGGPGH